MDNWLWLPERAALAGNPDIPRGWRHFAYCRLTHIVFNTVLSLLFGLKTKGWENVPENQACLFVCNHGSHYDGFLIYSVISQRDPRSLIPVLWYQMLDYPLVGQVLRTIRAVPVNNELKGTLSRVRGMKLIASHLREGRHVYIYPESVRSDQLGRFRPGAAMVALETGVPLIPVSLRGVQPLFKDLNRIPRLWGRVEVVFHPPLFPADTPEGTPKQRAAWLTQKARECIASVLDYPVGAA